MRKPAPQPYAARIIPTTGSPSDDPAVSADPYQTMASPRTDSGTRPLSSSTVAEMSGAQKKPETATMRKIAGTLVAAATGSVSAERPVSKIDAGIDRCHAP